MNQFLTLWVFICCFTCVSCAYNRQTSAGLNTQVSHNDQVEHSVKIVSSEQIDETANQLLQFSQESHSENERFGIITPEHIAIYKDISKKLIRFFNDNEKPQVEYQDDQVVQAFLYGAHVNYASYKTRKQWKKIFKMLINHHSDGKILIKQVESSDISQGFRMGDLHSYVLTNGDKKKEFVLMTGYVPTFGFTRQDIEEAELK